MMPTVYDIATKDIITIQSSQTLEEAISKMASSNLRTIVIINGLDYHILTTSQLIDFRLEDVNPTIKLEALNLPQAKTLDKNLNILNILNQINSSSEYMVIIDHKENLVGMISYTDIINNIDPQILMEKQTIGALILNYRATFAYENSSTLHAIKQMKSSGNDAVIILGENEESVGIFTTKDFINLIHLDCDLAQPIANFMTAPIKTLNQNSTIAQALEFIRKQKFKRIVITSEEEGVTGIITQKELLRVVYNKWIDLIKEEGSRISKTNEELLQSKSELEELASLDYLTKIYNRQKFESFLNYEINKLNRYDDASFSILLIDLDYFKLINDTYGHLKGDHVLQEVARILKYCSRESDVVARWGGEEFIMLLPHTDIEEAIVVGEKLRSTVEIHDFKDGIKLTCSIGIAQFHKHDNKKDVFSRADTALYKAKDLGRNRIEIEVLESLKN